MLQAESEARRREEERLRREAEAREVEEQKARRQAEEERSRQQAKARRLEEERLRREAEVQARAAEEARRLEEERLRREAEVQARAAEEQAQRLEEERLRREAEAQAQARAAEEEARLLAEQQRLVAEAEAQERAEKIRLLAEKKLRRAAETQLRAEKAARLQEEKLRRAAETRQRTEEKTRLLEEKKSRGPRARATTPRPLKEDRLRLDAESLQATEAESQIEEAPTLPAAAEPVDDEASELTVEQQLIEDEPAAEVETEAARIPLDEVPRLPAAAEPADDEASELTVEQQLIEDEPAAEVETEAARIPPDNVVIDPVPFKSEPAAPLTYVTPQFFEGPEARDDNSDTQPPTPPVFAAVETMDLLSSQVALSSIPLTEFPTAIHDSSPVHTVQVGSSTTSFFDLLAESTKPEAVRKRRAPWIVAGVAIVLALGIVTVVVILNRQSPAAVKQSEPALPVPPPGMVFVPGGEFLMGSDDGDDYEKPAHKTTVNAFFIDADEVTCEDYGKFIKLTGHKSPPRWVGATYPAGAARKPVTGVDWDDANAYAKWAGKRLPTEEEWEFAARGTTNWRYPWGNEWKAGNANAHQASNQLADVGTYKGISPFGIFDLIGNAWEWTSTPMHAYPGGHIKEDQLPPAERDKIKVLRGGCYMSSDHQATTTYRLGWPPSQGKYSFDQTGFRCALNARK